MTDAKKTGPKKRRSRLEFTDDQRLEVEAMAAYGVPQKIIARIMDTTGETLRLKFRDELDLGMAKANVKVADTLFKKAIGGDTAALIFWLKARCNWSEKQRLEHDGAVTIRVEFDNDQAPAPSPGASSD